MKASRLKSNMVTKYGQPHQYSSRTGARPKAKSIDRNQTPRSGIKNFFDKNYKKTRKVKVKKEFDEKYGHYYKQLKRYQKYYRIVPCITIDLDPANESCNLIETRSSNDNVPRVDVKNDKVTPIKTNINIADLRPKPDAGSQHPKPADIIYLGDSDQESLRKETEEASSDHFHIIVEKGEPELDAKRVQVYWTAGNDQKLLHFYNKHPDNWAQISRALGGGKFTESACRERYKALKSKKAGAWSPEETDMLATLYRQFGNKWAAIARHFQNRTQQQVKDKVTSLNKKKKNQIKPIINPKNNIITDVTKKEVIEIDDEILDFEVNEDQNEKNSKGDENGSREGVKDTNGKGKHTDIDTDLDLIDYIDIATKDSQIDDLDQKDADNDPYMDDGVFRRLSSSEQYQIMVQKSKDKHIEKKDGYYFH